VLFRIAGIRFMRVSAALRGSVAIGFLALLGGIGYLAAPHHLVTSLPLESSAVEKTREPLSYPFEADGMLFLEIRKSPNPWWQHLCQKRGEDYVLIDSIAQLRGQV
jgi:hypothetical protein